MGYSPRGREELDTTEPLHFTSFHFTYTSLIHLEFILILWNENYLILEEIQRLVGLEIMYWKNLDNKIFAVFGK